jgi:glutamate/tyrosine decarboxylase-like PLP-dependent enzyme
MPTSVKDLPEINYFKAHCSVAKGMMLAGVKMRKISSTKENHSKNFCLDPEALKQAIKVSFIL